MPGRKYWTHEYTARLPCVLLPLWICGIGLALRGSLADALRRPARYLLVVALFGMLLAMGNFAPFAPWSLLQRLPMLRDLRVPSRHLILMVLPLALLAGMAWDFLAELWQKKRPGASLVVGILAAAVILACAADGAVYSAHSYRGIFNVPVELPKGPQP